MKAKKRILLLALFVLLVCTGVLLAQEQAGKLFEKALFLEESEGNLLKAITLYEKIVKDYSKELDIASKAQLHIGFCYEKLGKTEAIKAYELVVENYSSQKDQVAAALARLDELKKEPPKGLSVVKLEAWDKPGMSFQTIEISPDGTFGVGVEFNKGQNIIVYNLETKEVKYITNHTWDEDNGYYWTYHPVLSPDNKEIVYYSTHEGKAGTSKSSLIVTTLDGQSRILASDDEEWYIPNAWLPDESAILTIKGSKGNTSQLGLFPKNGGDFKALVTLQKEVESLGRSYPTASISPNGRYILFTDNAPGEESDIYIVGADGENPKPLIKHPSADKYPRWSPDGKNIVFLSLRHGSWALWGVDFKDGEAGEPILIRDGMKDSYLLNWTDYGLASWNWVTIFDIFLMDLDPTTEEPIGKPVQLEFTPTGLNGAPVWSPDGKSLAFMSVNNMEPSLIIAKGSDFKKFSVPEKRGMLYPRWTPNGSAIGVMSKNEQNEWFLHRLSLDSEKWESTQIPVEEWSIFDWRSDKSILLTKNGYTDKGAGIFEFNLESGEQQYIYSSNDTGMVFFRQLKCSGDFKRAVFMQTPKDLMVVDLETGESAEVATDVGLASWSSDGQKILADGIFGPEESRQSLFIVPAVGGHVKEINLNQSLPKKSEIRTPNWSPDGKRIAFTLRSSVSEVLLFQNIIPLEK